MLSKHCTTLLHLARICKRCLLTQKYKHGRAKCNFGGHLSSGMILAVVPFPHSPNSNFLKLI